MILRKPSLNTMTTNNGWQYTVVAAAFVVNFLEIGTFKSLGVFVIPMMENLQTNRAYLGLVMSISSSAGYLFAPAITKTCEQIGERTTVVIGGILCSTSLFLSGFVDDVFQLGILFTITGFGTSTAFMGAIIAVSNSFSEDRKSTAIGIACSGGAFGVMVCPPIAERIIDYFGWRSAMYLLGAINANINVCGLLARSANKVKRASNDVLTTNNHEINNYSYLNMTYTFIKTLFEPFRILITKPLFIVILVSRFLTSIAFSGWAIFLVPHAIDKGLTASRAALLSSVGGIATIFGRLSPGPLVDARYVSALCLAVVTLLSNSIAYIWDHWANDFWSLTVAALINGFNFGSDVVLIFPLCVEVLGERYAIDGYGICFIPGCLGGIIGGLLIGYLFDKDIGWYLSLSMTSFIAAVLFVIVMALSTRKH